MKSKEITVDGDELTIETGDAFEVNSVLEFGDGRTVEAGTVVTVSNISRYPDGIHFEFDIAGEPERTETIYKFALENKLEDGGMHLKK